MCVGRGRGQKVTVHCTGYGKDRDLSKKFWSTKDAGQVCVCVCVLPGLADRQLVLFIFLHFLPCCEKIQW